MYSLTGDEYIEKAVKTYSKSMLNAAYSLLGSVPDAEDAVQEAFVKYIQKAPDFKNADHEKAWLLRVTINISKNMLKSSNRKTLPIYEDVPYMQNNNEVLQ